MKMTQAHKDYLDKLRESCAVNMFGSSLYLAAAFPELSSTESRKVVVEWMESFEAEDDE